MRINLKLLFLTIILVVFIAFINSQELGIDWTSLSSTEDVVTSVEQGNTFSTSLLPNQQNTVEDDNGLIKDLNVGTTLQNSIADVSEVKGNDILKVSGVILEGTNVESNLNGNFIPFFNLVDESLMGFDLDKNEKISVKQFKNGLFLNEFQSTLSKGAKLRQYFRDSDAVVTFEATEDTSFFIRKNNEYEFENGILTYRGNNIIETITTKDKTKANVDSIQGILKINLARDASYFYESVSNPESNFLVENKNNADYIVLIKKQESDTATGNFIDLVNHKVELNGRINLKKKINGNFTVIYEGLNNQNKIIITLDSTNSKIKSFYLDAQGKGVIANIYTSFYKIIENNAEEFKRYILFNEESPVIELYYSSLDLTNVVTVNENGELIRKGKNKYSMIARKSISYRICTNLLRGFTGYKDERFIQNC